MIQPSESLVAKKSTRLNHVIHAILTTKTKCSGGRTNGVKVNQRTFRNKISKVSTKNNNLRSKPYSILPALDDMPYKECHVQCCTYGSIQPTGQAPDEPMTQLASGEVDNLEIPPVNHLFSENTKINAIPSRAGKQYS